MRNIGHGLPSIKANDISPQVGPRTGFKLNGEPYKTPDRRRKSSHQRIVEEALALAKHGQQMAERADKYVEAQKRKRRKYVRPVNPDGSPVMCRHCQKKAVSRPRGLCWDCYYTPGVKELYPPTSKYARRGVGSGMRALPLAPETTLAMPGTEEKVAVMAWRAQNGFAIFHPDDGPVEADHLQRRAA